jgi:hypothetical protein
MTRLSRANWINRSECHLFVTFRPGCLVLSTTVFSPEQYRGRFEIWREKKSIKEAGIVKIIPRFQTMECIQQVSHDGRSDDFRPNETLFFEFVEIDIVGAPDIGLVTDNLPSARIQPSSRHKLGPRSSLPILGRAGITVSRCSVPMRRHKERCSSLAWRRSPPAPARMCRLSAEQETYLPLATFASSPWPTLVPYPL